jgi:ectoine hydroxylase-related dioxygenase (phytanoyl-CoA dioxygenase family)
MELVPADEEAVAAFAADGVACVRQVLDAQEVAEAAAAIDAVLAGPSPLAQVASGADDPGAFVEDFCRWQEIPQIERLARHSRVPAVAAALLATPQLRFYHDHVLVKEAATTQRTPWHQDQPYYNVDGHGVSAWIAVDPVPEGGSLELVAGSHRGPWLMPRTFLSKEARWFPEDGSGRAARVAVPAT